jgi:septum site-determining protein MinD
MPAKVITFHSYKGGTGKSFLSLNTAVFLSKEENKNVILLDFDFRAPTIIHKFPKSGVRYLNEFLEGKCQLTDVIYDISQEVGVSGENKFYVSFASPKTRDMQEMQMKTRKWQQKALTLIMSGLLEIKQQFDWIIFDSSPGLTYDSLNAMSSSDAVILVATPDSVDVQGTVDMSSDIYPSLIKFGAQPALVLNKVPWNNRSDNDLFDTGKIVKRFLDESGIPVISKCPCYCDSKLLQTSILVKDDPTHSLITNIKEITGYLASLEPRE